MPKDKELIPKIDVRQVYPPVMSMDDGGSSSQGGNQPSNGQVLTPGGQAPVFVLQSSAPQPAAPSSSVVVLTVSANEGKGEEKKAEISGVFQRL